MAAPKENHLTVQKEVTDPNIQFAMKFGGDLKSKRDTLKELMTEVHSKKQKDFQRVKSAQRTKLVSASKNPDQVPLKPYLEELLYSLQEQLVKNQD